MARSIGCLGGRRSRRGGSGRRGWAARIGEHWGDEQDVFVYFNNDPGGAAVENALRFRHLTG
ncbi:DUF72 domain-containing protein [Actinomadura rayongensis]|uniref:DUF72 domain-containing protein n=1 Tax=Actinomadura rayongensis TaxID=1429076 RepID=A0A6I4W7I6_9ACTN|nr:DUF72 domain-containing protein [Actinomadura rayongensis]